MRFTLKVTFSFKCVSFIKMFAVITKCIDIIAMGFWLTES